MADSNVQDNGVTSDVKNTATSLDIMARDDDFWYEDGNLVLVAGMCLFRVYKGLLASRSQVFRAMIVSSSPREDEMLDGLPIVYLSDTSHELRHFLRAMIPLPSIAPASRCTDPDSYMDPEALLAVARLAHKYEVDELLSQTLECLQVHYTSDFAGWDSHTPYYTPRFPTSNPPYYAIGVVNLARLTGTLTVLPVALYECCSLGGAIIRGWKRKDGVVERLSAEDIERCIDGDRALSNAVVQAAFRLVEPEHYIDPGCKDSPKCTLVLENIRLAMPTYPNLTRGDLALSDLRRCWSLDWMALCKRCTGVLEQQDRSERLKLWAQLPSIFKIQVNEWDRD